MRSITALPGDSAGLGWDRLLARPAGAKRRQTTIVGVPIHGKAEWQFPIHDDTQGMQY